LARREPTHGPLISAKTFVDHHLGLGISLTVHSHTPPASSRIMKHFFKPLSGQTESLSVAVSGVEERKILSGQRQGSSGSRCVNMKRCLPSGAVWALGCKSTSPTIRYDAAADVSPAPETQHKTGRKSHRRSHVSGKRTRGSKEPAGAGYCHLTPPSFSVMAVLAKAPEGVGIATHSEFKILGQAAAQHVSGCALPGGRPY
jgi:hypothetical protein